MSDRDARDILRGRAGWTEHIKMMTENREPPDEAPRRRLSITRLQRQTDAATELIALCQTVTEDGSLAVRRWLCAGPTLRDDEAPHAGTALSITSRRRLKAALAKRKSQSTFASPRSFTLRRDYGRRRIKNA